MKKILFVFGISFGCISSNAQIYCDFEDIGLAPESAWYGQDQVIDGDTVLTSGFYSFENNYNSSWGSFGGWSISNITDNVTTGWSNQFSAIPGGGTGSTGNYGVAYISEFYGNAVYFDLGLDHIDYMYVTNTTYAYFAMLNGDSFSKPFGADTNAQGMIDGTNGEDWFLLTIFGLNADSTRSGDSVNFYLADYRFSNDLDDYIIDDWTAIDLSTLYPAYGLEFELSSSDTSGGFGMNTPSYFAADEFGYFWGVNESIKSEISIYPNPTNGVVNVKTKTGDVVVVNDLSGKIIFSDAFSSELTKVDLSLFEDGVYFVTILSDGNSVTEKLIKK